MVGWSLVRPSRLWSGGRCQPSDPGKPRTTWYNPKHVATRFPETTLIHLYRRTIDFTEDLRPDRPSPTPLCRAPGFTSVGAEWCAPWVGRGCRGWIQHPGRSGDSPRGSWTSGGGAWKTRGVCVEEHPKRAVVRWRGV